MIARKTNFNLIGKKNKTIKDINYKKIIKKTVIRTTVTSVLILLILLIKVLNYETPKKVLNTVETNLEYSAHISTYYSKIKELSSSAYLLKEKVATTFNIKNGNQNDFVMPMDKEVAIYFNENIGVSTTLSSGLVFHSNPRESVVAISEGVIIEVGANKSIGEYAIVKHKGELISVYKYLDKVNISQNQRVEKGQIIGLSTEKLLLETWKNNKPIDPLEYIDSIIDQL